MSCKGIKNGKFLGVEKVGVELKHGLKWDPRLRPIEYTAMQSLSGLKRLKTLDNDIPDKQLLRVKGGYKKFRNFQ